MAKETPWDELIIQVLKNKGAAMRYSDIADEIVNGGKRNKVGATPANTVNGYLRSDKLKDKVVCVGRGVYILKEFYNSSTTIIPDGTNKEDDENDVSDALITAYGRFWDRNLFQTNKNHLYGSNIKTKNADVYDFHECGGIYLLHKGYNVTYVGQAEKLSKRLEDHTTDHLRNRWDNFSWFCIDSIDNETNENTKSMSNEAILDTLEALLIETLGPERNKKVGNDFEDKEFEQNTAIEYIEKLKKKK